MIKKIITLFIILIPINSYALIEVDITRGNLNPLPVAVSPLSIDKGDTAIGSGFKFPLVISTSINAKEFVGISKIRNKVKYLFI